MSVPARAEDQYDFDPLDPEFVRDPHATWARLREQRPVARGGRWGFWALTRHDDVREVSRKPKVFTSAHGITVPSNPVSGRRAPLHFDPPEHPQYRRPLNAVFSEEQVEARATEIRAVATDLVAGLVANGGGDVVAELGSPLAAIVFGMFAGIERAEAEELNSHSDRFEWAQSHLEPGTAEAENLFLYERCREIVRRRRLSPQDPVADLVSALLAVRVAGRELDDEFIAGSLRQVLIAAHVAPKAAIASAIKHLALDRELQCRLRSEPDLVALANEEFLRMYAPNQGFARTATHDTTVRGQQIERGEQVALVLTAANRDPEVFECPDEYRLGRSPNPHLAFGHGAHKCAGQPIARIEMRVAIEELLAATTSFELADGEQPLQWPMYGPEALPVRTFSRG